MKKLALTISCLLVMAGLSFGQNSINLYTVGTGVGGTGTNQTSTTVNPTSSFSIDTNVTFTGFTGTGLSYWLEVPDALAPFITITSETYFTWTDPNQTFFLSDPFNQTSGTNAGFMNEDRDLGGTSIVSGGNPVQAQPAGTYKVSTLNFSLSGAPAGTYDIKLTTLSPKLSEISDTANVQHLVSTAIYTLTVVPEPATWSLMGLGGLGAVGLTWLRARRTK
ncbi:MAG: PEP-CTERM sorting domain-containing protein [Chthoniobacterales bacterium]